MSATRDGHPRELLSGYLDGELDREERAVVEAHLEDCGACRALLQDFGALARTAAREAAPPVPAGLRSRIREAVERQAAAGTAAGPAWGWSHRLGLAAAAGVVLVIGLWAVRQESRVAERREPAASGGERARDESERAAPEPGEPAPGRTSPGPALDDLRASADSGGGTRREAAPRPAGPPPPSGDLPSGAVREEARRAPSGGTSRPTATAETGAAGSSSREEKAGAPALGPPAPPAASPGAGALMERGVSGDAGAVRLQVTESAAVVAQGLAEAGAVGRLVFEFASFTVAISEDGTLELSSGGYTCAARLEGEAIDPDVPALFGLATSALREAPGGRSGAPRPAPLAPSGSTEGAAAPVHREAPREPLPKATAAEMERRLRAMLQDRYLALLEGRCGPPPEAVRAP